MIPVSELDGIASARLEDAKTLLSAGRFDGASYLCGYAVEVALKARICRVLSWPDFPSTTGEFQAYRSFPTPAT
jgi:HEPN domain